MQQTHVALNSFFSRLAPREAQKGRQKGGGTSKNRQGILRETCLHDMTMANGEGGGEVIVFASGAMLAKVIACLNIKSVLLIFCSVRTLV